MSLWCTLAHIFSCPLLALQRPRLSVPVIEQVHMFTSSGFHHRDFVGAKQLVERLDVSTGLRLHKAKARLEVGMQVRPDMNLSLPTRRRARHLRCSCRAPPLRAQADAECRPSSPPAARAGLARAIGVQAAQVRLDSAPEKPLALNARGWGTLTV